MTGCRSARTRGAVGGVAGAVVLALWLLCCFAGPLQAQTAYFSVTGTFSNNSQTQDLFFGVGNVSNSLVLKTYTYGGGVTAAGVNVGSGGIDSTLNLYTGGGTSIAFNDDNPGANPGANGF